MTHRQFTLISALLIALATSGKSGVLPLGSPQNDFLYDRLSYEYIQGNQKKEFTLGPAWLDSSITSTIPVDYWSRYNGKPTLHLFGFATEYFSATRHSRTQAFESVSGGISAQLSSRLFAHYSMSLDEQRARDSSYTGKKWRGLAGGVDQAFVAYRNGNLEALLGRFNEYWGDYRSLHLGSQFALDGLGYRYQWGRLTLSYKLARLDGLSPERDSVGSFDNRFLAAHRLVVRLSEQLHAGLYEMVVFGGPGRQIDLYYLNPILLYHASQLNENNDDNTLVGFDVTYKPRTGTRLHAEFLIDDYQVEKKIQSDQEPNEFGISLSLYQADVVYGCDLISHYERVTNRTFNQALPRNRFANEGHPIGRVMGNDYDRFEFGVRRWMTGSWYVGLEFSHQRQGVGRITDQWTTPWMDVSGDYSESFPTGVVEHSSEFSLRTAGYFRKLCFFDLSVGVSIVKNELNISSDKATNPFIKFTISPYLFGSLPVGD